MHKWLFRKDSNWTVSNVLNKVLKQNMFCTLQNKNFSDICLEKFLSVYFNDRMTFPKKYPLGTFLVVQWLRIYAPTGGGLVSIPTRGIKILHATWYGQKTKLWKLMPREANNLEEGHRSRPSDFQPQCVSTTMMASDLGDSVQLLMFAQLEEKLMGVSEE